MGFAGAKDGLGGVWSARVGVKVDLETCLRVVVSAKGRRKTKAMVSGCNQVWERRRVWARDSVWKVQDEVERRQRNSEQ